MSGELIQIEKPRANKEDELKVLELVAGRREEVKELLVRTEFPRYLYWTEIKRRSWLPDSIRPETFWSLVKVSRLYRKLQIPAINYPDRDPFTWVRCSHYEPIFHEIDLNLGGRLLGLSTIPEQKRNKYISRQLIEESIASAQLEGAHTTREAAQKMIREGRTPADLGQRMIYNNYRAMRMIEEGMRNEPLTFGKLLELHAMLTEGTLEKSDQAGRLRKDEEKVMVCSETDGKIAHIPPPAAFVEVELPRLIAWANDELDEGNFTHPLIKAIALHFWLGYLHPFTDGNGRLARALFYWYMLRKGYWAFAFIPISTRIKKSPKQYVEAYIYSEQDDCDLTYFIDYNIRQLQLARKDFEDYLKDKESEADDFRGLAASLPDLNDRQLQLVQYLATHPKERTNVTSVSRIYGVTPATAVKDLQTMEQAGLLTKRKQGRNVFYFPSDKLLSIV